jgi:hypothetical protein
MKKKGNRSFHTLGKSREAELRRINKELTNIRQRFRGKNFNRNLQIEKHVSV